MKGGTYMYVHRLAMVLATLAIPAGVIGLVLVSTSHRELGIRSTGISFILIGVAQFLNTYLNRQIRLGRVK